MPLLPDSPCDDNRTYIANTKTSGWQFPKIESCTARIYDWMAAKRLKLNPSDTELVWLASSRRLIRFKIDQVTITPATPAK